MTLGIIESGFLIGMIALTWVMLDVLGGAHMPTTRDNETPRRNSVTERKHTEQQDANDLEFDRHFTVPFHRQRM